MVPGADRYYSADEYAGIDPYVVPGKPSSGLIAGIEGVFEDGPKLGEADSRLQSFNYRLCLAHAPDQRVPITQPDGYDEQHYELLFRLFAAGQTAGFSDQPMPNHKTDSNDQGRMSFDFIGGGLLGDRPLELQRRRRCPAPTDRRRPPPLPAGADLDSAEPPPHS